LRRLLAGRLDLLLVATIKADFVIGRKAGRGFGVLFRIRIEG